jgi:D-sedoheptulose 7-phosphate isomerase
VNTYAEDYLNFTHSVLSQVSAAALESVVDVLERVRSGRGRVFCIGVGGSAATASHLVNDLRKICEMDAYAPTDNVAELTARTNDDGWDRVFVDYLTVSGLNDRDAIFALSVGGGSTSASENICHAIQLALDREAYVLGIVGSNGGAIAQHANPHIMIPTYSTPHVEGITSVLCHLIISDLYWRP